MKSGLGKLKGRLSKNLVENGRPSNVHHKVPRGGEAIKEAILQATEKLLKKYNPTEISLRQIAMAANINHSLIHRYFGTKENVIFAVHDRIIGKLGAQFSEIDSLDGNIEKIFKISEQNPSRRVLLARAMLDGADPHLIRHHFPTVHQLIELLRKKKSETANPTEYDAETLAAFFVAAVMGWFLYEPFLLASTGLEKRNKNEVHKQIVEILEKIADQIC
jgi:TetR/AcrR family transcriptional regulator, repressor for neighboring sulfatase